MPVQLTPPRSTAVGGSNSRSRTERTDPAVARERERRRAAAEAAAGRAPIPTIGFSILGLASSIESWSARGPRRL